MLQEKNYNYMALKKYSFEIRSLKNLQDEKSPYTLSRFEFLAENKKQAEKYMETLIENYNNNMPFRPVFPRDYTELTEKEYI